MTWDRVERLLGRDNLALLAGKHVGVAGLGSGGGFVALSLAMSGVGRFTLIDDDVLEAHNVVRHVADLRDVGRPKAEVVADLIGQRNPNAVVEAIQGRAEAYADLFDTFDLLIVGVDGEQAKFMLNDIALRRALPAVYAGVYERGEGGDVALLRAGVEGPCYACWAAELRAGLAIADLAPGEVLDYGMIGADGTLEAEPGLWLHVARVAAAQADMALNWLLTGTDVHFTLPGNTLIMANRALEILEGQTTPPHGSLWVNIARDPDCLVCGPAMRRRSNLTAADDTQADTETSLDALLDATGLTLEEGE